MKTAYKTNVLNLIFESLIYIVTYALIITILSLFLKTIVIDKKYYYIYALLVSLIIYVLNKTIKPIIFKLTVPITGITMGLFYPCINVLILKIADYVLGKHFDTHGVISLFFTAVLISFIYIVVDELIIKPIIKRGEKDE